MKIKNRALGVSVEKAAGNMKIDNSIKKQIHKSIKNWSLRFPGLSLDVMTDDIARELSINLTNKKYCEMEFISGYYEKIERQESFIKELKSTFNKIKKYINGSGLVQSN